MTSSSLEKYEEPGEILNTLIEDKSPTAHHDVNGLII
jgi:hypothetical protein